MSVERYFSVATFITLSSIAIEKLLRSTDRIGMRSRTAVSKSIPVNPTARTPAQAVLHLGDERLEREAGVADQGELGGDVLVEIRRVERRVDDPLARGHRDAVVGRGEATADAEDQVGVRQEVVEVLSDRPSARAERQVMGLRERALALEARRHRRLEGLDKLAEG